MDAIVVGLILGVFLTWHRLSGHGPFLGGWRLVPLGLIAAYLGVRPWVHRWIGRIGE